MAKLAILAALSVAVGTGIGISIAIAELGPISNEIALLASDLPAGEVASGSPVPLPRAVVINGEQHDFGSMERDTQGKHTFLIRNDGQAPLRLKKGETTCKCTVAEVEKSVVQPGETAGVTIEWRPNTYSHMFSQRASVKTNDPALSVINLIVMGQVTQAIRVDPRDIVFPSITRGESTSLPFRVYAYRADNLEIKEIGFLDPELADFFAVDHTPLAPEELEKEKGAKSGVTGRVTVKPGLPSGAFRQTIRLTTNLPDIKQVDFEVEGRITGDISIFAAGNIYSEESNTLSLGRVNQGISRTVELRLMVKGPHREKVAPKIAEVLPQALSVELGKSKSANKGRVIIYPLRVSIKADALVGDYLEGGARIVIDPGHPEVTLAPIQVEFAVDPASAATAN